jgi:rhomboid protease GluP
MNNLQANQVPSEGLPPENERQQQVITVHLPTTRPWVTYVLIGLTVVIFLLQFLTQAIFNIDLPAALGIKYNPAIRAGQIWRLITPVLLHGSLLHIGFNMYALFALGPTLEKYYGHVRFLLLYLLAGFAGNVISFTFSQSASLGASTAIFGLVTAEGIFIYRNRFLFGDRARSMLINIGIVVVINFVLGFSPGIDNWGHLGGLMGGLAFGWFAGPVYKIGGISPEFYLEDQVPIERIWQAAVGVGLLFSIITILVIYLK